MSRRNWKCWLLAMLLLPIGLMAAPTQTDTIHLNKLADGLQTIGKNLLDTSYLSESRLTFLRAKVRESMPTLRSVESRAEKTLEKQKNHLEALGPAPEKGKGEAADIAKRRKAAEESVAQAGSVLSRARTLSKSSNQLLSDIADTRADLRNQGLVQRSIPLSNLVVWQKGFTEAKSVLNSSVTGLMKLCQGLVNNITQANKFGFLVFGIILALLLAGPCANKVRRRFGPKKETKPVTFSRRLVAIVATIIAQGVFPALAISCLVFVLFQTVTVSEQIRYTLIETTKGLGGAFIILASLRAFFTPGNPDWRFLKLTPGQAVPLYRRACLLTSLMALVWIFNSYALSIHVVMPPYFVQISRFILRVMVCASILILLRNKFWINSGLLDNVSRQTRQAFTGFRFLTQCMAVTNPLVIVAGYVNFANALFENYTQSVAVIFLTFLIFRILNDGIARLVTMNEDDSQSTSLSETARSMLDYWLTVVLGTVICFVATIALVLIWGVDGDYLYDLVCSLIFGFNIGSYHFSLINIFMGLATFAVIVMATRFVQRLLENKILPNTTIDSGAQHAIKTGIGYVGLILALIFSIQALGLNLSSLMYVAGGFSVGVSLALKGIMQNFVSGIIMLIERPIKIGDVVDIGNVSGKVSRISVRATEITNWQRASVLIPNTNVIEGTVVNWTLNNTMRRIEISVGVGYNTNVSKLSELWDKVTAETKNIASNPKPSVVFKDFGASSLDFQFRAFILDIDAITSTETAIRFALEKAFREANIEIPFTQCDVNVRGQIEKIL